METAVELQAGQTFAIAGLLQSRTEAVSRATPFFGEIPVFGALFRRVREQRNDIELLITVTPELVDAMDPDQTPQGGPGLNSMSPNDKDLHQWTPRSERPWSSNDSQRRCLEIEDLEQVSRYRILKTARQLRF